jgi:thiamine-monophosphate kinase
MGEFDLIKQYFDRRHARSDVLLGVGDDAAVLTPPAGCKLVAATDTIVEGVHFPEGTAPSDIGFRALAVNLSDIAAMGGVPAWMTLAISLPRADAGWLSGFSAGLFELADAHQVALVGGDTVRGPLVITITILGWVESDAWLTRSGARAGDALYVSGIPGEAAGGLAVIQRHLEDAPATRVLRQRFLRPEPRLELGRALRTVATAAMDVSDGLLTDVTKLCAASHCGAVIEVERLPHSAALNAVFDATTCLQYTLAGGDDYELVFTMPPTTTLTFPTCTRIGQITAGLAVECRRDGALIPSPLGGYDHFGGNAESSSS